MGSSTFAYVETQCSRVPFHAIGQIIEIFRKKVGPARDKQPFAVATLSSFSQPTNSSGTQPINFVSKIPSRGTQEITIQPTRLPTSPVGLDLFQTGR
jgi:hypothetical protein